MRASYTIQPSDDGPGYVWGVYSHLRTTGLATGAADTVDDARDQVARVFT